MKKFLMIALAILILAAAFQATKMESAAQADNLLSRLSSESAASAEQYNIASTGMDLTGTWDILLFYNDGGMDREIWYLTQEDNVITGHSRYITDQGDFVRSRMTGILNGNYLTMSIKSGQDYVTEFKAEIGNNGTTMGTRSTAPDGTSFEQTMRNINEGRVSLSDRQDRWINLNGQWWGQKSSQQTSMTQENWQYEPNRQHEQNQQYEQSSQYNYQYRENNLQAYRSDPDLSGTWDILLFYDGGSVNREIWYLKQEGSLITGHSRYRTDEGNVVRSRLTGRLNGSNLTMSLKSGDYVTHFQVRISDNGMSMGTKKTAPDGSSFNQTMRNIDEGRSLMEMDAPNRYKDGDWWGHKRDQQTSR